MQPSGTFTPGHAMRVLNPSGTSVGDAGGSAGSSKNGQNYLTEIGITNTGTPLCVNDALTSAVGGYHQLCLGANALGGGLVSYNAYGGAAALPLSFEANGTTFIVGQITPCIACGTMASQNANAVAITGGTINNISQSLFGTDQGISGFGTPVMLVGASSTGKNVFVAEAVNTATNNTFVLPVAATGYGQLPAGSHGNQVFGLFGLCEHKGLTGTCIGQEITVRNETGSAPDLNLPPDTSIGTNAVVPVAQNITCGTVGGGGNADCSIGIHLGNENGLYSDFAFNTGMYMDVYRQYGIVVEAMPSGNQTAGLFKTNGTGYAVQLKDVAHGNGNSILEVDNLDGPQAAITNTGHVLVNQLIATGHSSAPTLSSCGSGSSVGTNATDSSGYAVAGSAVTACTVNFGTSYLVAPACTVSGLNAGTVLLTAQTAGLITVSSASLGGNTFNWICLPQGG